MAEKTKKTKEESFEEKAKDFINNVKDSSKSFEKKDKENGKIMAILAYIMPLIPYFAEKKNKYVLYHTKQGMTLFIVSIAYTIFRWILSSIYIALKCGGGIAGQWCRQFATGWYLPAYLNIPMGIIGLAISVLCVMGIIDVINGKAKELPGLNKIKIFK